MSPSLTRLTVSTRRTLGLGSLALVLAACSDVGRTVAPDDAILAGGRSPHVVEVSPAVAEVIAGRGVQLGAVLRNPGGDPVDGRPGTTWTSSDPAVAVVDGLGRVTAVAAGTATITATFDRWEKSGTATVTVLPRTLRAVVVWGLDDGNSWIPGTFPGFGAAHLFTSTFQPKPAYFSVQEALDLQ